MKNSKENGVLNYIRVLLAVSIVLSTFNPVLVASASSEIELSISTDKVIINGTANVIISLANCENVTGVNMTLVYDESIVSLNDITENDSIISVHSVNHTDLGSGEVNITVTGLSPIIAETPIVNVTMLGVSSGTSSMELQNVEFFTTNGISPSGPVSGEIIVNSAPVLPEIGDLTINETETLNLSLGTIDADGDDLVYSVSNKPDNATFNNFTGDFSWIPVVGQSGVYPINFSVSDGYEYDTENVTITVNPKTTQGPTNKAPVLTPIGDQNVSEGNTLSFTVTAIDADNDTLTFTINNEPANATFNPITGNFSWTPIDGEAGIYYVLFGVTDQKDTVTENVTINVSEVASSIYTPSVPINFTATTGNFWALHDWDSGLGNVSDSYNVSYNGTWYNTSSTEFNTTDLIPHGWSNITVYAYNATSSILSSGINSTVQIANNPIHIADVASSIDVNVSETVYVDVNFTDVDDDIPFFSCNLSNFSDFDTVNGTGSFTPESAGTYYVNFTVFDLYGSLDFAHMAINVIEVASPIFTPSVPINFTTTTGNFWALHDWDSGLGNVSDSYNVSYNGTWYNTSSAEFNTTDLVPHGWSNITVYAYNATSSLLSSGINSTVQVANNPINITDVASLYSVYEGDIVTVDANFTDADYTDVAAFGCNRSDLFTDFNETDGRATWITDYSDAGTYYVEFNVTDSYGLPDSTIMEIVVSDVTHTPSNPVNFANTTGNFWVLHEWMPDSNGVITDSYNISYNGTWYNTSSTEFNTTDLLSHSWSNITVYAYNATTSSLSSGIESNVQVANNPIHITDVPSTYTVSESGIVTVDANFTDIDYTDVATFGCNRSDLFSDFNETDGRATWITDYSDAGTYYVEFNVTDSYGLPDSTIMEIVVSDVNYTPSHPVNFVNTTGNFWVLHEWMPATNGVLTDSYNVSYNGTWYNTSSTEFNTTDLIPHDWSNITVYAYNTTTSSLSSGIESSVQITNNPISITDIPSIYAVSESGIVTVDANFTDVDYTDVATFGCNRSDLFSDFNETDGTATWTTDHSDAGTYYVEFNVTDGYGLPDYTTMKIVVNNENRDPVFNHIGMQNVSEGDFVSFRVTANDEDTDDELTYSISGDPSGSTKSSNSEGMTFTWPTDYNDSGTYNITFRVDDEYGGNDTMVVPIVVANVNRAPTFDLLQPNYSINETDTLEINLGVNDQDKDSLTFWVNNTGNASGELNNDVYTWDTYYHDNGTYVIEFVVSDGTVNVSNTTTVYVNDVNAPPELTYIGSKTIAEEETLNFTVIATDEYDNDTLTYYTSNFSNNNATFNNETHLFSWTPISGEAGEYNITFYVTDGEDTVGEQVFITVTEASSSNEGSSSSSSSGGGGGGGSVSTGEEFENIFMKDYVLKSVIKDTETVFAFYKENNSIVSVSFTPKLNGGQVKAVVELLYGTSSQVSSDAPGDVYENMNIYVDTKLPSDAIGKSKVNFKVEKSWVNENGIDTSTITLCRYSNGWTKLPTEVKGEDDKYYYFIATTPGFSSFAISSVDPTLEVTEEASAEAIEENTQSAEAMMSTEDATQTELSTEPTQEGQSSIVPVIVLLGLIALTVVGIFGYRNRDYYEKVKLQLGNPDGKRYRRSKK